MISVQNLSRSFNGVPAVQDLTFEIPDGKLFTLLGPNGAGKTTTVRLLLGLIGPTSGKATVAGFKLGESTQGASALRVSCGLLTEAPGFYERMSAWDNLLFFGRLYGIRESQLQGHLERHLRFMQLWDRRQDLVGTFSKGMKQKLAIIRAIFHEPKVIFLDEPTAGLDPEAALAVREMILELKSEQRTIVVCTHNLDEAQRLADIVGILKQRLLVCDTLTNLQSGSSDSALVELELEGSPLAYQRQLQGMPFVKSIALVGSTFHLQVSDPRQNIPRLVTALVRQDAGVFKVSPVTRSLESIYLRCLHAEA